MRQLAPPTTSRSAMQRLGLQSEGLLLYPPGNEDKGQKPLFKGLYAVFWSFGVTNTVLSAHANRTNRSHGLGESLETTAVVQPDTKTLHLAGGRYRPGPRFARERGKALRRVMTTNTATNPARKT